MTKEQHQAGPSEFGIRFDTRRFDTQFLKRHWIKVVIQETPGGRYWECGGRWTPDLQQATSFASCASASAQAIHLNASNLQLVLTRHSKAYGIIPLKTGTCDQTSLLAVSGGKNSSVPSCRGLETRR